MGSNAGILLWVLWPAMWKAGSRVGTQYVIFKRVDILSLKYNLKNSNRSMSNFSCCWRGEVGAGEGTVCPSFKE